MAAENIKSNCIVFDIYYYSLVTWHHGIRLLEQTFELHLIDWTDILSSSRSKQDS